MATPATCPRFQSGAMRPPRRLLGNADARLTASGAGASRCGHDKMTRGAISASAVSSFRNGRQTDEIVPHPGHRACGRGHRVGFVRSVRRRWAGHGQHGDGRGRRDGRAPTRVRVASSTAEPYVVTLSVHRSHRGQPRRRSARADLRPDRGDRDRGRRDSRGGRGGRAYRARRPARAARPRRGAGRPVPDRVRCVLGTRRERLAHENRQRRSARGPARRPRGNSPRSGSISNGHGSGRRSPACSTASASRWATS